MKQKKLDNLIKSGLREKMGSLSIEKTDKCPNETRLGEYLEGRLSQKQEQLIAEHIRSCYWCIEQLDQAQRARPKLGVGGRKMSLIGKKTALISWIKKNKWLLGAAIAFILSFAFPGYFLQFLILTLLMGMKWVFATGGTKTVVMIYDALRRKNKGEKNRIRFKDRSST